jgi:competence protein ComEA
VEVMRKIQTAKKLLFVAMLSAVILYPAHAIFAAPTQGTKHQGSLEKVNVNVASMQELESVRGIGPSLADRIVSFRDANGKFESLEDLSQVRGIGSSKLAKIKNQVTL